MPDYINNLVVISDTHCGCKMALCPPKITLDTGGTYEASAFQAEVLKCWNEFWDDWVPKVTRGEPFDVVLNGDAMDGRHHGSSTPITNNLADQQNVAYEILAPIADRANDFYFIRGTRAHTGESAENEERLAEALMAVRHPATGRRSSYELYYKLGGKCLVHLSHHIGVTSSQAYASTAPTKELTEFFADSAMWRKQPPDVIVRSHRHRHIEIKVPTGNTYGIVFVTAGWQLKTPFVFMMPGGRTTQPQIGGSLIRQGDEEHYTRHRTWSTKRPATVMGRHHANDEHIN